MPTFPPAPLRLSTTSGWPSRLLSVLPGGFFYSQDAFDNAGISETQQTIDDHRKNFHQDLDVRGMRGDEPLPPISAALWKRERRHVWIEREISFSY